MDRRQFLAAITLPLARPIFDFDQRVVLLQKYTYIKAHYQGAAPDCTAHAAAMAVEILNAIEHALFDAPAPRSVRVAYLHNKATMPREEGAAVEDVIKVLKKGFLWRAAGAPYKYTPRKKDWPKPDARIKTAQRITSFNEAANAIKSLQPVIISSRVAFKGAVLDKDGFIEPNGNKWAHAWCMIGVDDRYKRPGGLLLSSWGPNWPTDSALRNRHNQPRGSAWVDATVLDRMLSTYGKSYAISDLQIITRETSNRRVIFYSSPTCQPCQRYKPIIAKFPEIETREANHNVSPVPQVWIIEDGQVIDTLVGLHTENKLKSFLEHGSLQ